MSKWLAAAVLGAMVTMCGCNSMDKDKDDMGNPKKMSSSATCAKNDSCCKAEKAK